MTNMRHPFAPTPARLLITLAAALVLAVAVPFGSPGYLIDQFSLTLVYAIAILGLNLITGFGGAITLGHGAFFAVGAYTSAILAKQYGWDPLATIPASGALCWIVGLLFGFPALRLQGLYLALGTLTLAVTVTPLLKRFEGLTGGHQGIVMGNPFAPAWSGLSDQRWIYLVTLLIGGLLFLAARLFVTSGLGRALVALRDNELVASTMGVSRVRYMSLLFAVSSLYAGVAGSLYAMIIGFVSPDSFPVMLSLSFFIAGVVGGLASVTGALWGALFIQFVPTIASDIDRTLSGVVYGVALIATLLVMPGGLAGALEALWSRVCRACGKSKGDAGQ